MKNLGDDVLARSARTAALSAMSALNAARQRGHNDTFGFAGGVRIETHHPPTQSADGPEATTRWPTA